MLQKVRKQGIRFWDESSFWHEMIYKSLIPTFGKPTLLFKFLIFYHSSNIYGRGEAIPIIVYCFMM